MKKGIVLGLLLLLTSISSQAGMTICNRFSCRDSYGQDPQEVLNALTQLFSGGKKEILFCMADYQTKNCYESPIVFGGRTNLASVTFRIPYARIYQIQLEDDNMQAVLDYQIQANQYYPMCSASNGNLNFSVSSQGDFVLNSQEFDCRITELGNTKMRMRFTLDYLDLEKGRLGGTYQASVRGDVIGSGSGYVILQLSERRVVEMPRRLPTEYTPSGNYGTDMSYGAGTSPYHGENMPYYGTESPYYGMGLSSYEPNASYYRTENPYYETGLPSYEQNASHYGTENPYYGTGMPSYETNTPYYGNETPYYGAGTPPYGSETSYGTNTPSVDQEAYPSAYPNAGASTYNQTTNQEARLVDWDMDNIKDKWEKFSTKFMKILYLEPLDD